VPAACYPIQNDRRALPRKQPHSARLRAKSDPSTKSLDVASRNLPRSQARAEDAGRESEKRCQEVQLQRAHASRGATVGQLAASIAHEVNQPIAGTLMNAQTARRWLARLPPDVGPVRDSGRGPSQVALKLVFEAVYATKSSGLGTAKAALSPLFQASMVPQWIARMTFHVGRSFCRCGDVAVEFIKRVTDLAGASP
jgi:hypothetical protein